MTLSFYIFYPYSLSCVSLHSIFESILGNDFGKSAKHWCLKADADVILHEEPDGRPTVAGSATISGVDFTDPNKTQRHFNYVDLNRVSGADLIGMRAVVIHKDTFLISYPYEFHRTFLYEVSLTLADVSKYGFYRVSQKSSKRIIMFVLYSCSSVNSYCIKGSVHT